VEGRVLLPAAQVLVIRLGESDSMLYRYLLDGTFVGDTWHETLDGAKQQVDFEYVLASPWRDVPPEVADPVSWARRLGS
jgi:hypothetical protein